MWRTPTYSHAHARPADTYTGSANSYAHTSPADIHAYPTDSYAYDNPTNRHAHTLPHTHGTPNASTGT